MSLPATTLYMVLLGCRPPGRLTEQHDVFFGIGPDLKSLVPQMKAFWPGVELHVDAYRSVERVGDYAIAVEDNGAIDSGNDALKLFFINLGAYTPPDFEEYHRKLLIVAPSMSEAIRAAKQDAFFRAGQAFGAATRSHVDDKMEVDEAIDVQELFPSQRIAIRSAADLAQKQPTYKVGYLPFSRLEES